MKPSMKTQELKVGKYYMVGAYGRDDTLRYEGMEKGLHLFQNVSGFAITPIDLGQDFLETCSPGQMNEAFYEKAVEIDPLSRRITGVFKGV